MYLLRNMIIFAILMGFAANMGYARDYDDESKQRKEAWVNVVSIPSPPSLSALQLHPSPQQQTSAYASVSIPMSHLPTINALTSGNGLSPDLHSRRDRNPHLQGTASIRSRSAPHRSEEHDLKGVQSRRHHRRDPSDMIIFSAPQLPTPPLPQANCCNKTRAVLRDADVGCVVDGIGTFVFTPLLAGGWSLATDMRTKDAGTQAGYFVMMSLATVVLFYQWMRLLCCRKCC